MACAAASLFALCLFYVGCFGKPAILKEPVKLSADRVCTAQEFTLIHRLRDDSPRTVATLVNGVWTPGDRYRERVEHSSTLSVWLTRVNYNDKGYYEFTCAGQVVTTIELEVLMISNNNLSVAEGDTVTLPCYFQTAGDSVDFLVWERNGEPVLNQSLSGELRYGTGFEGRVSVRSDWFEVGELSLTVERVQLEDRGDFFCFVHKSSRQRRERGSPAAVRVMVNERRLDQTTSAPVPEAEKETRPHRFAITATTPPVGLNWSWSTFIITAAGFVVIGLLGFLGWCLRNGNLRGCAQPVNVETPQHGEGIKLTASAVVVDPSEMAKRMWKEGLKRTVNQTVTNKICKGQTDSSDFTKGSDKSHPLLPL
ncbi:uncharacterized protein LOC115797500 [Archocentrus centrarchus]|uniref:uncharacterized protein LOC115797500 n=1 Tax=Archocentrus centrarchus TaxID=63155 RepID=UPI0011E9EADE|nr:uncharacterized protein LOC115797500 [Archocentrus centrarchus]